MFSPPTEWPRRSVGAHALLPTTVGVTVIAELTELGVTATAGIKIGEYFFGGLEGVIGAVTIQATGRFVVAEKLARAPRMSRVTSTIVWGHFSEKHSETRNTVSRSDGSAGRWLQK